MPASLKHIRHQLPVLRALGRSAVSAVQYRLARGDHGPPPQVPGPEIRETLPPRDNDLIRAYLRAVGGDPKAYRGYVPPHFFPQWGFPLLGRTLDGLPYPIDKALNGGCRLQVRGLIPVDEPLVAVARLEAIEESDTRVILRQSLTTGPESNPEALYIQFWPIIPKPRPKNGERAPRKDRERPRVPANAREIAWFKLTPRDALDFAITTGDFNPIHWVPAAARAAGFKNVILHGFAEMARAIETLNRVLWVGDWRRLRTFGVRFRRPLVLPARVGLYLGGEADNDITLGDAPGGPAYLTGSFEARE